MKRLFRLIRTLFILWILVRWSITIYANFQEKPVEKDQVQLLRDYYQISGHTQKREFQKDIEQLQWIKQEELDKLWYKATISFYESGTYNIAYIPQEKIDRLSTIDKTIEIATQKMNMISEPTYLKEKPKETLQIEDTFRMNLWK